jgi:hypothetical protein
MTARSPNAVLLADQPDDLRADLTGCSDNKALLS